MWKRSGSANRSVTGSPKLASIAAYLRAQHDRIRSPLHSIEYKLFQRKLGNGPAKLDPRPLFEIADDPTKDRPSDLCHLNRIGDLLARAGRIEPGIALFERVARAYAEDGFWAKAIAIYRKILRYDPGRQDIETQLAFLYQRSGLPIEA